jgi:hypothetical protein
MENTKDGGAMTQEIKPCPFCGGLVDVDMHKGRTMSGQLSAEIRCYDCEIVISEYGKTEEWAERNTIEKWNTRKG